MPRTPSRLLIRALLVVGSLALLSGCFLFSFPGSDARLASISIDGYTLDPGFDPEIPRYRVLVPWPITSIRLDAQPAEPTATVSYSIPDARNIPLVPGSNPITITVRAEDTATVQVYTIDILRCATQVTVCDSVNGSLLPPEGIVWTVAYDAGRTERFAATANPQYLPIEAGQPCTLEVAVAGRASSAREGLRVEVGENQLDPFVSQALGMSSFPATAPRITAFEFTMAADPESSTAGWFGIQDKDQLYLEGITGFRVQASGHSDIAPTFSSGMGICLGIDLMPTATQQGLPASVSSSAYDAASGLFVGTAIFDCRGFRLTGGAHRFDIVAYDRSNNRVERRYDLTLTSHAPGGPDISAAWFQDCKAEMRSFGFSANYFSVLPLGMPGTRAGGTSYLATISFDLMSEAVSGERIPILGFHILRSSDGIHFMHIGTRSYGRISTDIEQGTIGHTFHDMDSSLEVGHQYWYKVVAFTDEVHTKESEAMTSVLLPPFTLSLASPADGVIIDATREAPDFVCTVSDPAVLAASVADELWIALQLSLKDGRVVYSGGFRYRFPDPRARIEADLLYLDASYRFRSVTRDFGGGVSDYIGIEGPTIRLKADLFRAQTNAEQNVEIEYRSGLTYQWDITGTAWGGISAHLQKAFPQGMAYSFAGGLPGTGMTTNGAFEFSVR